MNYLCKITHYYYTFCFNLFIYYYKKNSLFLRHYKGGESTLSSLLITLIRFRIYFEQILLLSSNCLNLRKSFEYYICNFFNTDKVLFIFCIFIWLFVIKKPLFTTYYLTVSITCLLNFIFYKSWFIIQSISSIYWQPIAILS